MEKGILQISVYRKESFCLIELEHSDVLKFVVESYFLQ